MKFSTLLALAFAFALSLGVAAPWLRSGVCQLAGLDDGCVLGGEIAAGTFPARNRTDASGADFHQSAAAETVLLSTRAREGTADKIIREVALMAPTVGVVVVNASGFFTLAGPGSGSCSISTNGDFDPASAAVAVREESHVETVPFGLTRAFQIPAGTAVFNLVCTGAGDTRLTNPALTAVFAPTRY